VSATVVVISAPPVASLVRTLVRWVPPGTQLAAVFVLVLVLAPFGHRGTLLFGRWRNVLVYPPAWVAVLLGFAFACAYWTAAPAAWRSAMQGDFADGGGKILLEWSVIAAVAVAVAAAVSTLWRSRSRPALPTGDEDGLSAASVGALHDDSGRLLAWLRDDAPIDSPAQDAFGQLSRARRIVRRITAPIGESPPAMAIVGPLGSGKTSLRKLVEDQLKTNHSVRLLSFSAWPYDTVPAVVAGILGVVVDALNAETGALVLGSLPERYVESIAGAAYRWGGLFRAMRPPKEPKVILRQVDEIAAALGIRVVLWVEDLERFGAGVGTGVETDAVRERLAPIRALLYELETLRYVSVVVASPSLTSGFDLEKLARHIEVLEPIAGTTSRPVLAAFRGEMLRRADAAGIISVESAKAMAECNLADDSLEATERAMLSLGHPPESRWNAALLTLCTTPRALKQGLRDCLEILTLYRGELDLDHVLAACLLRQGHPGAFAAIVGLADRLRGARESKRAGTKVEDDPRVEMEEAFTRTVFGRRSLLAVQTVFSGLFHSSAMDHPQGFGRWERVDYWRRYLSLPEMSAEESDQSTLREIKEFVGGRSDALAYRCFDLEGGLHVEWFQDRLDGSSAIRLVDIVLKLAISREVSLSEPPGNVSVWRIAVDRARRTPWRSAELLAVLRRHIQMFVPTHLALANGIMRYYGDEDTARDLLDQGQRGALRDTMVEAMVAAFQKAPAELASALDWKPDHFLSRLVWGIGPAGRSDEGLPVPFDGWARLAPIVLQATRERPEVMLAQLAVLVSSQVYEGEGDEPAQVNKYNEKLAFRLFGQADITGLFRAAPAEVEQAAGPNSALLAMIRFSRGVG
jgi:hypothetical protein